MSQRMPIFIAAFLSIFILFSVYYSLDESYISGSTLRSQSHGSYQDEDERASSASRHNQKSSHNGKSSNNTAEVDLENVRNATLGVRIPEIYTSFVITHGQTVWQDLCGKYEVTK